MILESTVSVLVLWWYSGVVSSYFGGTVKPSLIVEYNIISDVWSLYVKLYVFFRFYVVLVWWNGYGAVLGWKGNSNVYTIYAYKDVNCTVYITDLISSNCSTY